MAIKRILASCCAVLALFGCLAFPAFATDNDVIEVIPIQNYDGLLPDPMTGNNFNVAKYWIVFRYPNNALIDNDSGGKDVVYSEDTQWVYKLYWFTDDYEFVLGSKDDGSSSCPHLVPILKLNASSIYEHTLVSDSFEGVYVTDTVLKQNAALTSWKYEGVENGSTTISGSFWNGFTTNPSEFSNTLRNTFVASNFFAYIGPGSWSYLATKGNASFHYSSLDEDHGATDYTTPGFYWEVSEFIASGSGSSGDSGSGDVGDSGWLSRIWSAIVNGFNSVIEKLDEIIENLSGNGGIDEGLKEDSDNAIQSGQNIQDGMNGIIGDFDSSSSVDDFFGSVGEDSGNLDFFGDEEKGGFFGKVSDFFDFMRELWSCFPLPVQTLITFVFVGFLLLAVFKMFF